MGDTAPELEGVEDAYPLTAAQQGMLFHSLADPASGVYIGCFSAALPIDLDLAAFQSAWQTVVQRHTALRTVFVWEGLDVPVQVVLEKPELNWEEARWPSEPEEQKALLEEVQQGGVDLASAPALRFVLFSGEHGGFQFAWLCHHALVDIWSAARVFEEVAAVYAEKAVAGVDALEPAMPFRDFIDWIAAADVETAERYWLSVLGDFTDPANIQLPEPERSAAAQNIQKTVNFTLNAEETRRLSEEARRLRVTPNAILGALWGCVLARLSGQEDVVFGLAVTQRPPELDGIESAVGNFVTTLPARVQLDSHDSLRALIKNYHDTLLASRNHATLSLNDIQKQTGAPANAALFETILALETRTDAFEKSQTLFSATQSRDRSNFPLSVMLRLDASLACEIRYDPDRFTDEAALLMGDMWREALTSFHACLDAAPAELSMLSPPAQSAADSGITGPALSEHNLVHLDIQAQARRFPDRIALHGCGVQMTYGELERTSEVWAGVLHANGIGRGSCVALFMQREPYAVLGMLSILRAGASYVPVNAGNETDRNLDIIRRSGAKAVLTQASFSDIAAQMGIPHFCLDNAPPGSRNRVHLPAVLPTDTAYVMYTSGSTGKPKGVVISHANLAASTAARQDYYPTAPSSFLLLSSIEFDSSVVGIYWTLSNGGTLVFPAPGDEQDISALAQVIETHEVSHLLGLPSLLELLFHFAPERSLRNLQVAISAGEALTRSCHEAWQKAAPHARLYNEYGPTEATVWCIACEVSNAPVTSRLPIGLPTPGVTAYLRDAYGRGVPDGLPGELWIGGAGVAQGYLDAPELSAEKFVPDPMDPSTRLYRTGDLVWFGRGGQLEYLGRADHQVKVRGHRIEPGEIEAVLTTRQEIRLAAVQPFAQGQDVQLTAFVVLEHGATLSVETLRTALRQSLPPWMVPARFVVLADLPRTSTGKIDRNALVLPPDQVEPDVMPPRTPLEEQLAAIWKEVLWIDHDVGVNEDFELLGGHSLLSIRLVNEIETRLQIRLPASQLGRLTTIADQAHVIEHDLQANVEGEVKALAKAGTAPGIFEGLDDDQLKQMHGYMSGWPGEPVWEGSMYRGLNTDGELPPLFWCFNWGKEFAALAEALGSDQPLYGTRSGHLVLDVRAETQQWDNRRVAMQSVAEVLKIQPDGPYYLGGNCQGAAVAMETAQVLHGLALPVGLVLMMEAIPEHAFHGRVALLFGDASDVNPYASEDDPETLWRQRYLNYTFDTIKGRHGQFFTPQNVRQLGSAVSLRLSEAREAMHSSESQKTPETAERVVKQPVLGGAGVDDAVAKAVDAMVAQAQVMIDIDAIEKAALIARAALDLDPRNFAALKQAGLIKAAQNDPLEASRLIRSALDVQEDPVLRVHLARLETLVNETTRKNKRLSKRLKRLIGGT